MPAGTTSLTVTASNPPSGVNTNEQSSDVSPGNSFPATAGKTRLFARNTTGGPLDLVFEADKFGAEVDLLTATIPANGSRVLGPFPAEFLDHSTTDSAKTGHVMVRQASGTDGQIVLSPFE